MQQAGALQVWNQLVQLAEDPPRDLMKVFVEERPTMWANVLEPEVKDSAQQAAHDSLHIRGVTAFWKGLLDDPRALITELEDATPYFKEIYSLAEDTLKCLFWSKSRFNLDHAKVFEHWTTLAVLLGKVSGTFIERLLCGSLYTKETRYLLWRQFADDAVAILTDAQTWLNVQVLQILVTVPFM